MPQFILTAVGDDRPGLVGELTGQLHSAGANILDSRMVNLRGRFAVIVLFEAADAAAIRQKVPAAAEKVGLTANLNEHIPPAGVHSISGLPFRLKTYSLDQPGLVHAVSTVLRNHRVNIEDLSAWQESAAFAGDALFIMEMRLTI